MIMAFEIPVYLIEKRTGQFDENGVELVIVYDIKLMRGAADAIVAANPGTEVRKMMANKTID
jgi:hypothetical protein